MIGILAACLYVGYRFFLQPFFVDLRAVDKVRSARSTWTVTMQEYDFAGPLSQQTYRINNDNGKVRMFYSATSRNGLVTKQFLVPLDGPSGTFLFEQLRVDGIWELDGKPLRSRPKDEYVVAVAQTLGDQGGSRAFGFSDPRYWASTNAREFQLSAPSPKGSGSELSGTTKVRGRTLRDDRYLKIVDEIRNFGPPSVLKAEDTIRSELAALQDKPAARASKDRRG